MIRWVSYGFVLVALLAPRWAVSKDNPIEVGTVRWQRDFDAALDASKESGKPLFVLFQEIPGCSGCQAFGRDVLSNPLLVEAIEDEFIPVLIYNNRAGGDDSALLKRFGEPAWNYQVVRFLDADGKDLIPRKDRVWSTSGIAARSVDALKKAGRPVPKYLRELALENDAAKLKQCAFSMYCFWTGEVQFGKITGVISTEAGWIDHQEVTRVTYNEKVISLEELKNKAGTLPGIGHFYSEKNVDADYHVAKSSDQKRQLSGWKEIRSITGITPMQLTKINAFAPTNRKEALEWLSPRQRSELVGL